MEGFVNTNIEITCSACGLLIHLEARGVLDKPDQLRAAAHQRGESTCEGSWRELTIGLALQPMMAPKVREVRISRLANLGSYENEKVEMTAAVGDGEDAKEVALQVEDLCRAVLRQPTRAIEQARKTVARANGLWRLAREAARSYVRCDELSRSGFNDAESYAKDVPSMKESFERAHQQAKDEESRPEVIAARGALGEEVVNEVALEPIRAEIRNDYNLTAVAAPSDPEALDGFDSDDSDDSDDE